METHNPNQSQASSSNAPKDKDIEENKTVAMLSYIWILFLIPLFSKKDSKFCQFHAKQGLVLFIASLVISLIGIIPILGWITGFILGILLLILAIMGIVKALQGEYWEMPVLGQYAKKFNL
ncbi:MAG: DUF4870 domain-containing protein [Patescibacteria group bacterium]